MASIPYVGPVLGVAAMAAILAAGTSLVNGAAHREMGGPVRAGQTYVVGEKRAEVFVPGSDGYIFPDASKFGITAPAVPTSAGGAANARLQAAVRGATSPALSLAGNGGSSGNQPPNVHLYLDKSAYIDAIRSDMTATAHEVYDKRDRT